jgi:hypothetical protein
VHQSYVKKLDNEPKRQLKNNKLISHYLPQIGSNQLKISKYERAIYADLENTLRLSLGNISVCGFTNGESKAKGA